MSGSVSRQKQARFLGILSALLIVAVLLITFSASAPLQAFGAGLAYPGGGFLLSAFDDGGLRCLGLPAWIGHLIAFLLTLAFFAASVIFWFGAGNIILPPLIWAFSAAISAWLAPPVYLQASTLQLYAAPVLLCVTTALPFALTRLKPSKPQPTPAQPVQSIPAPLTFETLALSRFALDRALQPLDQFEGFQFVDQFQTAATRYQIAQNGYALSLLNSRLPAFRGYLHQAQVNLILKQCDARIWRYWQYENAWGNFDLNPDPIARDNIMYTGFLAAQIAMFQAITGDMRFSRAGALQLTSEKHQFSHDQNSLIMALYRGWNTSEFTLMPCEPNWIYPLCNAIGASAAIAQDQQQGTNSWTGIASGFRNSLEQEFTAKDGRILPFRSSRTGIPSPHVGGAVAEAYPSLWWNSSFPDVAAQQWSIARNASIRNNNLKHTHFWKVDTGDYRLSRAASFAGFAAAAAEMGDAEARDLALAALESECPHEINNNSLMRRNASVFAHMTELIAWLNPGNGIHDLMHQGITSSGPLLDTEHYQQLNVLQAEHIEGVLHITLRPVSDWPDTLPLRISNLPPNAQIRWAGTTGGTGQADPAGTYDIPLPPALVRHPEIRLKIEVIT